jgi:spermine oxidase
MASGDPKSVIVIGAGVAGLTVASKLVKNPEYDVMVLEAGKRIGGRVHSYKFGNKLIQNQN